MRADAHSRSAVAAGVVAITVTYVYFLLFAEFALLELAQRRVAGVESLRALMALLGLTGVLGSVAAARMFRAERFKRALGGGFVACAAAAALAVWAGSVATMATVMGVVGASVGWVTVTLASGLRGTLGVVRLGAWCGVGTGAAYAVCNVPAVFDASSEVQAMIAIVVALAGAAATRWLRKPEVAREFSGDYTRRGAMAWVAVLLALVWLDSAAFYVIQHAPTLKAATWTGAWQLWGNALSHFVVAVATGVWLDRRGPGVPAALAAALLIGAGVGLRAGGDGAAWLYTAGVSVYSALLVFYPARSGRPALAAGVYAIAGWVGSALGIGMAQELKGVPDVFLAVAAVAIAAALAVRWRMLAAALVAVSAIPLKADADPQVAFGRQVYVSEGCIHCHSQFVRPHVMADVERWGPATPLATVLAANPPLLGNRRQGPDLADVGNRRSAEWQRLHLKNPRAIVAGSRMPAYAYLFSGDAKRGEALVTYLTSLGGDTWAERAAKVAAWTPAPAGAPKSGEAAAKGRGLFQRLCAACHGGGGRADGPLALELSVRPPDFTREAWRRVREEEPWSVERVVKFGVPGTTMAGHEYLGDDDVMALAAHVRRLHDAGAKR